jgi:hypothetical protein
MRPTCRGRLTVVCFNPSTKLTRVRPAELIVARLKELSTRRKFVSYFAPLVGLSEDEERILREELVCK